MENPYEPPPEITDEQPSKQERPDAIELVYYLGIALAVAGFLLWALMPTVF